MDFVQFEDDIEMAEGREICYDVLLTLLREYTIVEPKLGSNGDLEIYFYAPRDSDNVASCLTRIEKEHFKEYEEGIQRIKRKLKK